MSDNKPSSKKSDSSSVKSKHRSRKTVRALPTKVIIRNLPPKLTSKQFLEQVSPISDHNYYYYVKGDPLLGLHSYSRAYINFINQDDILHFREKFDNYVFLDDKGSEYTAVVELALYQGVPKRNSKKIDPKCKTIENDPNFLQFLEDKENLSKANNNLPSVEECLEEIKAKEEIGKQEQTQLTPLLEYLNNKKKNIESISIKKKILTKDDDRLDKKKKDDRRSKWRTESASSTSNTIRNKENSRDKESRRFRRRRDEKKNDDKYRDDDRYSREDKYRDDDRYSREDKYRGDKFKSDRLKDNKSTTTKTNATNTDKKDEPKATFTVKILTNDKRNEKKDNQSNKDSNTKSNDKDSKKSTSKLSNKERPSIQIYKPRQSLQNKDDKKPRFD